MATNPAQELLTPEDRRARLCAFADRMLICAENMAPPEDMLELERAVRVATLIERIYARVHLTEVRAPALAGEHLMNRLKLQEDKHYVRTTLKRTPELKPVRALRSAAAAPAKAPTAGETFGDDDLLALHALLMPVAAQATPLRAPSFQTPENPLRQRDKPEKRVLSGLPPSCQPQPPPPRSP